MKSLDVAHIYDESYFLNAVDGYKEFESFNGEFQSLFERYQRNIKLLELKRNHKFLEVGCGRGEICIYHACNGGIVKGVDFSNDAINMAKKKSEKLGLNNIKFESIPFQDINDDDNTYDRILASEFIEHISNEEGNAFMRKMHSLLKDNGKILIFTHPNTLQRKYGYPLIRLMSLVRGKVLPKEQDDTIGDHYKLYHLNEQNAFSLKKLAQNNGFRNISIDYDSGHNSTGIKKILVNIIKYTPLKHILMTNLVLTAEK